MTGTEPDLLGGLLADLDAEGDALRSAVADLDRQGWSTPTPAPRWSVATQVAHLAWTDETATIAATDKAAWDEIVLLAMADPTGFVDHSAEQVARLPSTELLARWDQARADLAEALRGLPEGTKMPWFGPPMSAASMATARYMETWAHSLDVYAALEIDPPVTDRIRHVAHLGVRTRDFAFGVHELTPPTEPFRIELTAPSGETWTWGPEDAEQQVSGSAYDFCLLVTQRVHRDDTDLSATGPDADRWLDVAQCFAGPSGAGRVPVVEVRTK